MLLLLVRVVVVVVVGIVAAIVGNGFGYRCCYDVGGASYIHEYVNTAFIDQYIQRDNEH